MKEADFYKWWNLRCDLYIDEMANVIQGPVSTAVYGHGRNEAREAWDYQQEEIYRLKDEIGERELSRAAEIQLHFDFLSAAGITDIFNRFVEEYTKGLKVSEE